MMHREGACASHLLRECGRGHRIVKAQTTVQVLVARARRPIGEAAARLGPERAETVEIRTALEQCTKGRALLQQTRCTAVNGRCAWDAVSIGAYRESQQPTNQQPTSQQRTNPINPINLRIKSMTGAFCEPLRSPLASSPRSWQCASR